MSGHLRALTKQEYSPQPKNILANPGQNPPSITTSRENSREKPATNRKVTQESGHLSDCPSRGSFGTVIHPQHNVKKNGTDIQKSPRTRCQTGNTNQLAKAQGVSAAENLHLALPGGRRRTARCPHMTPGQSGADVLPPSWKKPNFEDATYKIL